LKTKTLSFILTLLFFGFSGFSQVKEKPKPKLVTRILFVFDGSKSMLGNWQSDKKITIANRMICNILDSLKDIESLQLGLRVYGHQKSFPPQDCDDSKLEVPIGFNTIPAIKSKLKQINPKGTTPIAASLELAGGDFTPCENCRNIIILITDGLEECKGDPCAVSLALQKKGVALKPFIIGIGKSFKEQFECVGTYFDATNERDFGAVLKVVISQALNSTTAQVNLLDESGKATETNVNMTFYDDFSGLIKYNYIHTFDDRGLPDTLVLDPLLTYNIVVHTIPPVGAQKVKLNPGKHTIIPIDAPQGNLEMKVANFPSGKAIPVIVRKAGKMETLNVQYMSESIKYITGKYDLEFLTLPRLKVDNVEIKQSSTTTVEIPTPGIALIIPSVRGYGSLFKEEDNKLTWIYNLNEEGEQETLYLLPGKYRVVFRSKYANKAVYTIEKSFKIESGSNVRVNVYQ
jgi:Ca-activated chloride channel family protein